MYIISGRPIPLSRPRLNGQKFFDSQKSIKDRYKLELISQRGYTALLEGPLELNITFIFSSATSKLRKYYNMDDEMPHSFKPDLSNLIKFVEDAAQGVLFRDDCTISIINAKKEYGERSGTEFTITCIDMSEYEK